MGQGIIPPMREIKINKVYRHFKGDSYIVVDVAFHSETKE